MAVVIRYGISHVARAQDNGIRWVENPGDAAVFADQAAANSYLSAAGFSAQVELLTVSGQDDEALRTSNN